MYPYSIYLSLYYKYYISHVKSQIPTQELTGMLSLHATNYMCLLRELFKMKHTAYVEFYVFPLYACEKHMLKYVYYL